MDYSLLLGIHDPRAAPAPLATAESRSSSSGAPDSEKESRPSSSAGVTNVAGPDEHHRDSITPSSSRDTSKYTSSPSQSGVGGESARLSTVSKMETGLSLSPATGQMSDVAE